ncbi:hypothetical protein [Acinetobacter sp. 18QD2AZ41W]|uniref:hypothetical protein n=1 Tax=Acinetobacter sp. 18QD2AZ41W TaxID=2692137 RepID=UPI001C081CD3|nr:hypothetical protein [Acinetobacter sp. 18QD2AZ41W]
MDIEKLKTEFEQTECFKRLEHVAQYTFFEFGAYIKRTDVPADIEKKCGKLITALLFSWSAWKEAKTQAVPEWKDYTVESPRIDGPYQIFIMNQQLVAKWESPWGFSSIEDGDALNQELITHWSVLGNDPAIEPREPAND